jgi:2,3-bisphosphoglycerate-dependent phosphoglycerate mutase
MRLFVFARHAESIPNVASVLNSDPSHPAALTPRGRRQARKLGAQLANLYIGLAVCTRFPRTRQTAEIALRGRDVPLLVEPGLDEIQAGVFDGAPIEAYWAWKEQHPSNERFPHGESLDEAVRRYVDALHRLLARTEAVTLIVGHELALRYIARAAVGPASPARPETGIPHAVPYLFDERALRRAAACLDALAPPAPEELRDAA